MRAQVCEDERRDLHDRATDYLEAHRLGAEAIDHALAAGSLDRATELIEREARPTFEAGELATLLGNPSQYDDLDAFRREQDLLRRLASESILPLLELNTSDGDMDAARDRVADWMSSTGGLWPREAVVG